MENEVYNQLFTLSDASAAYSRKLQRLTEINEENIDSSKPNHIKEEEDNDNENPSDDEEDEENNGSGISDENDINSQNTNNNDNDNHNNEIGEEDPLLDQEKSIHLIRTRITTTTPPTSSISISTPTAITRPITNPATNENATPAEVKDIDCILHLLLDTYTYINHLTLFCFNQQLEQSHCRRCIDCII